MPVPFSSPRRRRTIIIGGSMSGLFAAAFLRQKGWDADVYERSTVELVGRGAGITTHPELLDALRTSGAGTRDLGVEVEKRIALDRDGRVIAEKYLPQILTSWDRLQRLLRETTDAARYHLGHTFERVEQDGSGVVVHFAGGRSERADILIGSDGIRSSVRAQVAPAIQPIYSGYYIWRGAPNEADLKPQTRESIFPYFTFFLPQRQQIIGYPIAGLNNDLRFGHRRYNFIWYRVGDAQQLHEMCVDENGHQHAYSVPPPLIRKDLIAQNARRCRSDHAAAVFGLPQPDAAVLHADLRLLDPTTGVRARCAGRGRRVIRAPAHGLRHGQGRRRHPGARRGARQPRRYRRRACRV
jgi:2-polyprenyl-6-methoxyphenol hydroxylase-like FAD-dependent oxidoreductase